MQNLSTKSDNQTATEPAENLKTQETISPRITTPTPSKDFGTYHYRTLDQFEKNEKASAEFKEKKNFHRDIEIVRKKPTDLQDAKENKFRYDWLLKKSTENYPYYEAIASEIARLVVKDPKTRWLDDYVLSKKVEGFKNFTQLELEEGENIKKKILNGTYKGFIELLTVNLFLGEIDPKTDNMGVDDEGWVRMIDREWSFSPLSRWAERDPSYGNRAEYSVEDIKQMPYVSGHDYQPFNYFDLWRKSQESKKESVYLDPSMPHDPVFLHKKYSTMLKLALVPGLVWYNLVKSYVRKDMEVEKFEKLLQFLARAKLKMAQMLLLVNAGFILSAEAHNVFDQLKIALLSFRTTQKRPLCSEQTAQLLGKEFEIIKSLALEHQKNASEKAAEQEAKKKRAAEAAERKAQIKKAAELKEQQEIEEDIRRYKPIATKIFQAMEEKMYGRFQMRAKEVAEEQVILGLKYENGPEGVRDMKQAVFHYRAAADKDSITAQYQLARCCAQGLGMVEDMKEALFWYKKAADQGHAMAQYHMGRCYANGIGVDKDMKKALGWYVLAAWQGDANAQYSVGLHYEQGWGVEKNSEEATKWYAWAAEKDHMLAQFKLGGCYKSGQGVEKNETKAMQWFRLAARQGHSSAQYYLAKSYEEGRGVKQNIPEALELYRFAASQGHKKAQAELKAYTIGRPKNEQQAQPPLVLSQHWHHLATENNDATAQYNLALCYEYGLSNEENMAAACYWYYRAAENGIIAAHDHLARCYDEGRGVPIDMKQAVSLYGFAARKGNTNAQYHLGLCYEQGRGVAKDLKEAVRLYQLAFSSHISADYRLSLCYQQNPVLQEGRYSLFELSAQKNHAPSLYRLGLDFEKKQRRKEALECYKRIIDQEQERMILVNHVLEQTQESKPSVGSNNPYRINFNTSNKPNAILKEEDEQEKEKKLLRSS